ncbi:hypothetical protein EW145_g8013, partial [Phellinidium pouzarii]
MPGSSELSDALNPFFYQVSHSVSPPAPLVYEQHAIQATVPADVQQQQQQLQRPQQLPMLSAPPYTSELADAINPSAASPMSLAHPAPHKHSTATYECNTRSRQSPADPIQLLKGLIQSLASYKAAVEREKKRRMAWEHEEVSKYIARIEEMREQESKYIARIAEMQLEIDALRVSAPSPTLTAKSTAASSSFGQVEHMLAVLPLGKYEAHTPKRQPEFVQGSSASPPVRKRARSSTPNIVAEEHEPMRLRTHRDSRPQTIQAAMRNHLLISMNLEHDKMLPESHIEGAPHDPSNPVRFVWEQTTKKSAHNAKMRKLVITDIIARKELYPLVPVQEFTESKLESVFDQAFTTLRQKYITQSGSEDASTQARERGGVKARRARRASRKKIKLANRISTRKKFGEFSVTMFDAAFQMECMSSEESSEEEGEEPVDASSDEERHARLKFLRIRYLAWRSLRLTRLFQAIDMREEEDRSAKPKRGVGRKDRRVGPPKDGNPLPPPGVAQWMVSKKWQREARRANPRIAAILEEIMQPDVGDDDDEEYGDGGAGAALQALRV